MWIHASFKKEGLSIPAKTAHKSLQRKSTHCQEKHKGVLKLVVTDEHAMTIQQQSHQIDLRWRETMHDGKKFGGVAVVSFGDPGQLPPASANSLWIDIFQGDDLRGLSLCKEFKVVIKLIENKRMYPIDPNAVIFDQFLDKLRDSESTEDD